MRYIKQIFVILLFFITTSIFSQTDEEWKNKRLYTGMWLGYGTGFSMAVHADWHFHEHFSVGIETGLSDNLFPTISFFPKAVFRPLLMEISVFAGPKFGYNKTYEGLWGAVWGLDIGLPLGPGILYGAFRDGMGYSFGLGYKIGLFVTKRNN